MGIYSTNRYGSMADFEVVAAEGYNGEIGAAIALIEGYENDLALFNGVISTDFQEAAMINEGASYEEVYALQEGALSGAWAKLKEFFKKLIEKVKAIFHSFIAKFNSVFMKDSKEFYKKYLQDINRKSSWEGFKCKVRPVKDTANIIVELKNDLTFTVSAESKDEIKKKIDNWDADDEFARIAGNSIDGLGTGVTSGEFEKEYMNLVFEDEEPKDDWSSADITGGYIGNILKDNKKLDALEKANKKLEDNIKKIISKIDKASNEISKIDRTAPGEGINRVNKFDTDGAHSSNNPDSKMTNAETLDKAQAAYELAHKQATVTQEVILKYTGCSVKAYKEAAAQARRVYAAAVAFSPKNESVFAAAVGDVAYYEACDLLDTMYDSINI